MSVADAGTDAGMDSSIPVGNQVAGYRTGGIPGPVSETVHLVVVSVRRDTFEQSFHLAESGKSGYVHGNPGGYSNVGTAEDDHNPQCRPSAASPGTDDGLDAAADVCFPLHEPSQRTGVILGNFNRYPYNPAVL